MGMLQVRIRNCIIDTMCIYFQISCPACISLAELYMYHLTIIYLYLQCCPFALPQNLQQNFNVSNHLTHYARCRAHWSDKE